MIRPPHGTGHDWLDVERLEVEAAEALARGVPIADCVRLSLAVSLKRIADRDEPIRVEGKAEPVDLATARRSFDQAEAAFADAALAKGNGS